MSTVSKDTKLVVVGVLGRIGAGKSTFCRVAEDRFGAHYFNVTTPLKAVSRSLYGLSRDQVWGTTAEKEAVDARHNASPRELMRRVGRAVRGCLGEDVWVLGTLRAMAHHYADQHSLTRSKCLMVVDSLRFTAEVRSLLTFRSHHSTEVRMIKMVSAGRSTDDDETEVAVDDVPNYLIDHTITNNYAAPVSVVESDINAWLKSETAGWSEE